MATAFVDDTGDTGTAGLGLPWFCWVALVVSDGSVSNFKAIRDDLAKKLRQQPVDPEHWDGAVASSDNLIAVLRVMNHTKGWAWVAVASYTPMSTPETARLIHVPTEHRYYTTLILLERLSWIAEAWGEEMKVVIDRPNDGDFTQSRLRTEHGGLRGSRENLDSLPRHHIYLLTPVEEPVLNCAHALAYAFGKAVNPHRRLGETFPEYVELVRDQLWVGPTKDGRTGLTDIGITLLPYDWRFVLHKQLPFLDKWWMEHFAAQLGRN